MFNFLREFLSQFAQPIALVGVLLFAVLFLIKKQAKVAILFILICLILVGGLGSPFFATYITRSMEWRNMPPGETPKADAIIVLSGGTQAAKSPRQRVELQEESDRLLYAAMLYQQKAAPYILLSGGNEDVTTARSLLLELGVPEEDILLQDQSHSTSQDAQFSVSICNSKAINSALLVTSALNMERASFAFEGKGLKVIPYPVDYRVTLEDWQSLRHWDWKTILTHLMPTSEALKQSTAVLYEYCALAYYRLKAILSPV